MIRREIVQGKVDPLILALVSFDVCEPSASVAA